MRRVTELAHAAEGWRFRWSRVARVVRRIVGAPDYAAYVEHCRKSGHPAPISEKEYVREFFEAKRTGVRCC